FWRNLASPCRNENGLGRGRGGKTGTFGGSTGAGGRLGACTGRGAVGASTTLRAQPVRSESGAVTWETGPDCVFEPWVFEIGEPDCAADADLVPASTAVRSPVRPVAALAGEPLLAAPCAPRTVSFRTCWAASPSSPRLLDGAT